MRVTRRYRNPLLRRMPVPSAAHRLAVSGNALWRKSADTPDFEIAKHFHTLVVPTPLSRPRFAAVPSVARTVPPSAPFTLPNFFLSFTFFFRFSYIRVHTPTPLPTPPSLKIACSSPRKMPHTLAKNTRRRRRKTRREHAVSCVKKCSTVCNENVTAGIHFCRCSR